MDEIDLTEHRKLRLLEFAKHRYSGNRAALGRALGYIDGAFVGQMLRGERPITEKTILQVHKLPGGAGWFDSQNIAPVVYATGDDLPISPSQLNERRVAYRAVSLECAVESIAQHLDSLEGYDRPTVINLLSMLANSPHMHGVVASGLKELNPGRRNDQEKQSSPEQKVHRPYAA